MLPLSVWPLDTDSFRTAGLPWDQSKRCHTPAVRPFYAEKHFNTQLHHSLKSFTLSHIQGCWVVPILGLIQIKLLWTFVYKFWCEHTFSNFWNQWPVMQLQGPMGEGDGTPLQYSCLENPVDGGAWKAAVHEVAEGWTWLSDFTFTFHFHALEKEMATHSGVLAWRIPGTGEPGGLPSMGSHRVGHDWRDSAAAAW